MPENVKCLQNLIGDTMCSKCGGPGLKLYGWIDAGYPAWTLYYTQAAEFAGAVLLLLGVYSRYVALFALPVIVAVAQLWLSRKGFWFSNGGLEFPLCWTVMLVAVALLGDGAFALKVPAPPWERAARRAPA